MEMTRIQANFNQFKFVLELNHLNLESTHTNNLNQINQNYDSILQTKQKGGFWHFKNLIHGMHELIQSQFSPSNYIKSSLWIDSCTQGQTRLLKNFNKSTHGVFEYIQSPFQVRVDSCKLGIKQYNCAFSQQFIICIKNLLFVCAMRDSMRKLKNMIKYNEQNIKTTE